MYGRKNTVLKHFGADELATLGTLQAIEERRLQGEYIAPEETVIRRPPSEFDEYFEFDRPVPSGLPPHAHDCLVEEATSSSHNFPAGHSRAWPPSTGSYSPGASSPGPRSPGADPQSRNSSPPPQSYESSPQAAYGGHRGFAANRRASGSPEASPAHQYNSGSETPRGPRRQSYGQVVSPHADTSPSRSVGTRSPSLPPYDPGARLQQPPFRAGAPTTPGARPARQSGATASRGGGGPRRTSTSADVSRAPSASPSPRQPLEADPSGGGGDSNTVSGGGTSARRGLGARIAGRPASARTPSAGAAGGAAAAASRRPASAAASGSAPQGGAAGARRGGGVGRRTAAAGGVPAWAPASGISELRLDEMDEATRVALMLNDPAARQQGPPGGTQRPPQPAQPPQASASAPQSPGHSPGGGYTGPSPPGASPPPPPRGTTSARASPGGRNRASASDQYFERYRLRKHREAQGVPDYRYSQPRSFGPLAPITQRYFSFDEAHPAIADEHYVRSPAQENLLQAERRRLHAEKMRAAQAEERKKWASRSRPSSARSGTPGSGGGGGGSTLPSARRLAADVDRLARVREAGRGRLKELEQEGEELRQATWQVQQRALDVIARSEHITVAASRSPSVSPEPRRLRGASAAAYYSGRGGGSYSSRGGFGDRSYYSRSPSPSPSHHLPTSATAGSGLGHMYGSAYGEASYTATPTRHAYGEYEDDDYVDVMEDLQQRPVSASLPMSMSSSPGPAEAQHILRTIEMMEGLPEHESERPEGDEDPGGAAAAADPLVRASAVATARRNMGALGPDEQRIAMGMYDKSRYQEYQRQVDLEMQRRAVDGGYDSDLDRDDAAATLVEDKEQVAREEEERRKEREGFWERENEWMDEYRQRFGPEDGYQPFRPGSASAHVGPYGSLRQSQASILSEEEEDLLQQPYVPYVSQELILSPGGYASEGPDVYHPNRRTRRRLFNKSTIPEPFQFEERQKARQKPIKQVKLEQDLALRKAEEEAAYKQRFRALPLPEAVLEPRYEQMLLEAEAKRQLKQQHRLEELASVMEKPFSFYYRDQERRQEREAMARAAKDPNRFQASFRARDVPDSTKEERFRVLMVELEARREASRRRVEEARRLARERAEDEAQRRREAANRAYKERLRAVDPAVHPYPPKPLGVVPDFNTLHRQNEVHMARTRAYIRKRVTVPQEFKLNGSNRDEQAARVRKADERRRRIILDMQIDAELLPEQRWPHKSPRGKVRRTPLPAYLVEYMVQSAGNHTASARKSATAAAAQGGAYMTRTEREAVERKASEKARAEALRRADRLLKAAQKRREEQEQQQKEKGGSGKGQLDPVSDVSTALGGADQSSVARDAAVRRRAAVAGRQDNPEVYVEARHAQIERRVREVVEDALLDQGIEAYRYVEGIKSGGGKKGAAAGKHQD